MEYIFYYRFWQIDSDASPWFWWPASRSPLDPSSWDSLAVKRHFSPAGLSWASELVSHSKHFPSTVKRLFFNLLRSTCAHLPPRSLVRPGNNNNKSPGRISGPSHSIQKEKSPRGEEKEEDAESTLRNDLLPVSLVLHARRIKSPWQQQGNPPRLVGRHQPFEHHVKTAKHAADRI